MWGDEPQLLAFRERLKLLLEAHQQELNPTPITAKEGSVLFRQGDPVDTLMLLTSGKVALDVHEGNERHTLEVVEAVKLLGEMGFFANGQHYADFRVVDGAAELLALPGDLLQAMLVDSDLAVEMLALVSVHCRRGSRVIGLLLSGIEAVHDHETEDSSKQQQGWGDPFLHCQGKSPAETIASTGRESRAQLNNKRTFSKECEDRKKRQRVGCNQSERQSRVVKQQQSADSEPPRIKEKLLIGRIRTNNHPIVQRSDCDPCGQIGGDTSTKLTHPHPDKSTQPSKIEQSSFCEHLLRKGRQPEAHIMNRTRS